MNNGETWNIFHAKNSWGDSWGDNGFMHFRKDCPGSGTLNTYQNAFVPILAPPYSSGVKPSAPGNPIISGTPTSSEISFTWTASTTAGQPAETYTLFCMPNSATTCSIGSSIGTSSAVGVSRGITSGKVGGLSPSSTYKCCVEAKNSVGSSYNTAPTSVTSSGKYSKRKRAFPLSVLSCSLYYVVDCRCWISIAYC